MFNTNAVREKVRSTFDLMRESEEIDRFEVPWLPAAPIYELEGVIDVLLAQIEKEQLMNEILSRAVDKLDDLGPQIRESVEEQCILFLASRN
ncbi:hypothetical protein [Paenibacillus dendritiformis]|uniref:hypothetical protein n=1 Tax=Paenibacillus dendritiformis TaxID=130049 RepID=UPI00387E07B7